MYILITSADRELNASIFENLEDAQFIMEKEYEEAGSCEKGEIHKMNAWKNDIHMSHTNLDWQIIESEPIKKKKYYNVILPNGIFPTEICPATIEADTPENARKTILNKISNALAELSIQLNLQGITRVSEVNPNTGEEYSYTEFNENNTLVGC